MARHDLLKAETIRIRVVLDQRCCGNQCAYDLRRWSQWINACTEVEDRADRSSQVTGYGVHIASMDEHVL